MGVVKYDIREAEFDRSNSENYELSILLGVGSFTYIVREKRSLKLLAFCSKGMVSGENLRDWVPQLQRTVQEDELLRPNLIKQINISLMTDRVTLVPSRLFEAGREAEYLSHLTAVGLEDRSRSETIPELAVNLAYLISEERLEACTRRFSPLSIRHHAYGLLKHWGKQSLTMGQRAVYACIRDQYLILCGMDSGKIQFFNVFQFQTAQDALYYVVLAFQQSGWPTNRVPLYLCGEILAESEVYRQLYRFVEDIRFSVYEGVLNPGTELAALPSHVYYDLLCQF